MMNEQMKQTKLFFDLEFTGLHKNTTIISLGIVADSGQTFYAEFTDYDKSQVNEWIQTNVIDKLTLLIPNLEFEDYCGIDSRHDDNPTGTDLYKSYSCICQGTHEVIKPKLLQWLAQFESITMIGDVLAYDWVLFQSIFGTAFDMPSHINYIPVDISTLMLVYGIPVDVNREEYLISINPRLIPEGQKHTALYDAKVTQALYKEFVLADRDVDLNSAIVLSVDQAIERE